MKKHIVIYVLFIFVLIEDVISQNIINIDTIPQQTYTFGWGTSPYSDVLSINGTSISSLMFNQIDSRLQDSKLDNAFIRSFNSFIVQYYLGGFVYTILPHELGHYFQAEEADIKPRKLRILFPKIGGFVLYDANYIDHSAEGRMLIASRGMETSASTNYLINTKFYSGDKVPQHYFWYYFNSKVIDAFYYSSISNGFIKDPNNYFITLADAVERKNGIIAEEEPAIVDDPVNYLLGLTESYGYYDKLINFSSPWVFRPDNPEEYLNDFVIDQNIRMKKAYALQLLDPALINSFYGLIRYIAKGKVEHQPYMLKINKTKIMPAIRVNLGMIGVENYFDLYVSNEYLPSFNIYYRTGGNMHHSVYGSGIEVRNIKLLEKLNLSTQIDYWYNERTNINNFNIGIKLGYSLLDNFNFIVSSNYKTKGSLVGKPVSDGFYGWFGFGVMM